MTTRRLTRWMLGMMLAATPLTAREASPREAYNQGAEALKKGYLREAENWLLRALAAQRESVQPPALYDLGHVRFRQGQELLKGESARKPLIDRAETAQEDGIDATMRADRALKKDQLMDILDAYLSGRPVRKQMRLAHEDVQRALDLYGSVLVRWRRSVSDFRSADELKPSDDSAFNGRVVERHIEELLKHMQELEEEKVQLGQSRAELKQKMAELKKKIPEGMMQPGEGDEEEDEEEEKGQPKPESGFQDQAGRDGEQRGITPEIAQQILEALGLKGDRKLPIGGDEEPQPKKKSNDW